MPNSCVCTLKIKGDPEDVGVCLASIGSPGSEVEDKRLFDFERVIPLPREEGIITTRDVAGLWGTKWNARDVTIDRKPDGSGACIQFWTAWTPPVPVIETLADQYPSLEIDLTYIDPQAPIAGRLRRDPADGVWRSIEASYDHGFCQAAVQAESWIAWDDDAEARSVVIEPDVIVPSHP
jgi:hypothetical protein